MTLRALAWLLVWSLCAPVQAAERTRLTIYTASQLEQVAATKAAIEQAIPEVEAHFVRASAGIITQRVLDESEAPQADMIIGLAASSMIVIKKAGLLAAYRPSGTDALRSSFLDTTEPYSITGMDVYVPVICLDPDTARQDRIGRPQVWSDLLDPRLKGRIVMANPAASGTGFGLLSGWIQSMGEERAWAFMDALDANVAGYYPTGSGPCLDVARGEHLIGLGLDMRAAVEKARGARIESVVPLDRTGWDLEAFGIVRSTPHRELAQRVADWATTRAANEIFARSYAIVAHPDAAIPPSIALEHAEARLVKANLVWMADNRDRIIAEWLRRYGDRVAGR